MRVVAAGAAVLVLACASSLVALNERAARSPAAMLVQKGPVTVWQQIGAPEPSEAARQLMKQNDNFGYKAASTQMLEQKASTFPSVWQQIGVKDPHAAANALFSQNDNFGYKARPQMLADIQGSGAARRAARNAHFVPLPSAGSFGTDRSFMNKGDGKGLRGTSRLSGFGTDAAFLHMGDGEGQSTKGRVQMLADIQGSGAARRAQQRLKEHSYVQLPNAGALGTNKAFAATFDGAGLGHVSSLSGFGTDAAFLNKGDGKGQSTKGRVERL